MADEHVWTNLLTLFENKKKHIKHFISETTLETGWFVHIEIKTALMLLLF